MRRKPAALPRPTDPSHDDNWDGGYYELSIKLGPADDPRLRGALTALWSEAALHDPFQRGRDGAVDVSLETLFTGDLSAIADIPHLGPTLCALMVVREEEDDLRGSAPGADWLDLCLPLGALGHLDRRVGAYPFDDFVDSGAWRRPIEAWFASTAAAVFSAAPFEYALTGFEVSGCELAEVLEQSRDVGLYRPSVDGTLEYLPGRA